MMIGREVSSFTTLVSVGMIGMGLKLAKFKSCQSISLELLIEGRSSISTNSSKSEETDMSSEQ
jgi:hypothetical protein